MCKKISLAAARINAGMTQDEAAKALKVSKNTIFLWEHGGAVPGPARIALSKVYDWPEELFDLPEISIKI